MGTPVGMISRMFLVVGLNSTMGVEILASYHVLFVKSCSHSCPDTVLTTTVVPGLQIHHAGHMATKSCVPQSRLRCVTVPPVGELWLFWFYTCTPNSYRDDSELNYWLSFDFAFICSPWRTEHLVVADDWMWKYTGLLVHSSWHVVLTGLFTTNTCLMTCLILFLECKSSQNRKRHIREAKLSNWDSFSSSTKGIW